jgi:predicted DNA-binding mobile mystery protein A
MLNTKQQLLIQQTDKKLAVYKPLESNVIPSKGWINTVRISLKMSLRQLGNRLKISSQSVKEIEDREANGTITLNSLKDAANAMDLNLVYGFIAKHGSLEQMIEVRAKELATEIVMRTNTTMTLEEFVQAAFEQAGLHWRDYVIQDPSLFRPTDLAIGRADPGKAAKMLHWQASIRGVDVVKKMYQSI